MIAIRVRNGPCQLGIYRLHRGLRRLWERLGIRPLFVFHRFSFTHRAIERLLQNRGFEILSIRNSPLTRGEPYQIRSMKGILQVGKTGVGVISDALFRLSAGRAIAGPSLLAWARKPRFGEFPGFQRI